MGYIKKILFAISHKTPRRPLLKKSEKYLKQILVWLNILMAFKSYFFYEHLLPYQISPPFLPLQPYTLQIYFQLASQEV